MGNEAKHQQMNVPNNDTSLLKVRKVCDFSIFFCLFVFSLPPFDRLYLNSLQIQTFKGFKHAQTLEKSCLFFSDFEFIRIQTQTIRNQQVDDSV